LLAENAYVGLGGGIRRGCPMVGLWGGQVEGVGLWEKQNARAWRGTNGAGGSKDWGGGWGQVLSHREKTSCGYRKEKNLTSGTRPTVQWTTMGVTQFF